MAEPSGLYNKLSHISLGLLFKQVEVQHKDNQFYKRKNCNHNQAWDKVVMEKKKGNNN